MAPFSAGVALAPATRSSPAFRRFRFGGCEGLASESFPLLVPLLPLLTSRAAVLQTVRFLANIADQAISVNCRRVVGDAHCGQELRGKSRQLVRNPLEQGTLNSSVMRTPAAANTSRL
jgi:hypothetical protein